jgi:hypothetical protein
MPRGIEFIPWFNSGAVSRAYKLQSLFAECSCVILLVVNSRSFLTGKLCRRSRNARRYRFFADHAAVRLCVGAIDRAARNRTWKTIALLELLTVDQGVQD